MKAAIYYRVSTEDQKIEALLSQPELVLTELQNKQEEASKANFLERDLETIRNRN